ncbi:protein ripply1 isoform X2 [Callorhinus ursinus]|uniref:protein ripply1 isoform X2 n=1 Tax=Callorhinus ursinus TaxID=34884 RepID=UPI003CCFFC79
MDPSVPAAAAPVPALALAPTPVQRPRALLDLLSPSPLVSSGQRVGGRERLLVGQQGLKSRRLTLSSITPSGKPVAPSLEPDVGPSALPVLRTALWSRRRLFWPKARSFDYLYSDGEILLQNFPVQATINLYEDSDSEEEEEEEEKDKEEEKKRRQTKGGWKSV